MLYNTISRKKLKESVFHKGEKRITISFYKYFYISSPKNLRNILYEKFKLLKIFGRIYISSEGINAQISILRNTYKKMCLVLKKIHFKLSHIHMNVALNNTNISFWLLSIKVRKKIVSDGINQKKINFQNVGIHLNAKQVNDMIENSDVVLLDMRNKYEYEIGHFKNANIVLANTFREQIFLLHKKIKIEKNKNIIMYCTGGIRCEKSSALLQYYGFKNVYQIRGGIIEYVRYVKKYKLPTYFQGNIFVFDNRMVERISNNVISSCHQCGIPCDNYVNCNNDNCHFLFIQCRFCFQKYMQYCSFFCMLKNNL